MRCCAAIGQSRVPADPWRRPRDPATFRARSHPGPGLRIPMPATMIQPDHRRVARLLPEAQAALSPHRPGGGLLPVRRRRAGATSTPSAARSWPTWDTASREIAEAIARAGTESRVRERHRLHPRSGRGAGGRAGRRSARATWTWSTRLAAAPRRSRRRSSSRGSTGWRSGEPAKRKILALAPGYHGNTLLALSASARAHYKTLLPRVAGRGGPGAGALRVPLRVPGHAAALPGLQRRRARGSASCARARTRSPRSSPSRSAARRPARRCPRRSTGAGCARSATGTGCCCVADEVLTGAGRTGTWSALEPYGVVPDIMTLGKGIAGGLRAAVGGRGPAPDRGRAGPRLGRPCCTRRPSPTIRSCARPASRRSGTSASIAWSSAAPRWARCFTTGSAALRELPLRRRRARPRAPGRASSSWRTRRPGSRFRASARFAEAFAAAALEAGLVVWPNVGHADGVNGDLAMLAPPFVVTEDQIDEIVQRFGRALRARRRAHRSGAMTAPRQDHLHLRHRRPGRVPPPVRRGARDGPRAPRARRYPFY